MSQRLTVDNPPSTGEPTPPDSAITSTSRAIPSHPAPKDAAATSSGVAADAQQAPAVPTTDPASPMEHANSWKPSFERRQSWNKEDHKRELQMSQVNQAKAGPGFTERA